MKLEEFINRLNSIETPERFSEIKTHIFEKLIAQLEVDEAHSNQERNIDLILSELDNIDDSKFLADFMYSCYFKLGILDQFMKQDDWESIQIDSNGEIIIRRGDMAQVLTINKQLIPRDTLSNISERISYELEERFDESHCVLKRKYQNKYIIEMVHEFVANKTWIRLTTVTAYQGAWIKTILPV